MNHNNNIVSVGWCFLRPFCRCSSVPWKRMFSSEAERHGSRLFQHDTTSRKNTQIRLVFQFKWKTRLDVSTCFNMFQLSSCFPAMQSPAFWPRRPTEKAQQMLVSAADGDGWPWTPWSWPPDSCRSAKCGSCCLTIESKMTWRKLRCLKRNILSTNVWIFHIRVDCQMPDGNSSICQHFWNAHKILKIDMDISNYVTQNSELFLERSAVKRITHWWRSGALRHSKTRIVWSKWWLPLRPHQCIA